jgi:uncharacterized protein (TIGR03435 family)
MASFYGNYMRFAMLICLACCAIYAQSFEVASIKPSAPPAQGIGMRVGCSGGPGTKDPGRWTCENMRVIDLITMAYELKRYQMGDLIAAQADRFNIAAPGPDGAPREQFGVMQRDLL